MFAGAAVFNRGGKQIVDRVPFRVRISYVGTMSLTHAERKRLQALRRKKERLSLGLTVVEGNKLVTELLDSDWKLEGLWAVESWEAPAGVPVKRIREEDMARIRHLDSPSPVLALCAVPEQPDLTWPPPGKWLALDGIRDPGNLGTLIRLADWFQLAGLLLSADCVEWSNPKVLQASMGSCFRVSVQQGDLGAWISGLPAEHFCAGAFLDGENLYQQSLPEEGILVLGNESQGIRPEMEALLSRRLSIPRLGGAESLNVAMAGTLFCSEWCRKQMAERA